MSEQLDVYRDWLGISEAARPLDYYQLLRLDRFADDTAKIRSHYQKMNAHVRKFATGDRAKESQELLNELARAMLCLTDQQRKREYDASLGRKEEARGRRRTLEEILLAGKMIDRERLTKARDYAEAVGLEIRDALVQQKMVAPDVVMLAYAESVGLPYVELEDVTIEEELVPLVPPAMARQHSCVPLMTDEGQLLMASPNPLVPDVEEELRLRFDMPVRTVLCTPASINKVILERYPRDAAAPPAPTPRKPAAAPRKAAARHAAPEAQLSREEKIRRQKAATLITFNVTVILYIICRTVMGRLRLWDMAIAALLAGVSAAVAFVITARQDK